MYSEKTLVKYEQGLNDAISWYARFPAESLVAAITDGNVKIGHVLNVSLPPIESCGNCAECKGECYDVKACMQYKNVMNARARNWYILKANYNLYWEQVRDRVRKLANGRRKYKAFRFHVGGEIPSARYFADMVKTARMFPTVRFWTYTKMFDIVNTYIDEHGANPDIAFPDNFHVQFSRWFNTDIPNKYDLGEFLTLPEGEKPPKGYMKCPGNCEICLSHGIGCPYGMKVWAYVH